MTSVRNLLQPLNGNSFLPILILLLIYSCGSSKKTTQQKTPVEVFKEDKNYKAKRDSIATVKKADSISDAKSRIETIEKNPFKQLENKPVEKKKEYNILCILPFNAGELWKMDLSKVDNIMPKEPKQTLQYFEGLYLAMSDIQTGEVKINFLLHDNKRQDSTTKDILELYQKQKTNIDILIAPFHTKQAQIVAEHAKANKIPCFLPYNPSDKISNNNPYLFKINPSLINTYKKIYSEYINGPDSNNIKFHFVYKENVKGENYIAKAIEKYTGSKLDTAQIRPNPDPKKVNFTASNYGMKVVENFVRNRKNIFFIPSADDKYVNTILSVLKPTKDYDIEIYGIPSWESSELLDQKNLENKSSIIYTDYYIDEDSSKYNELNKRYYKLYGESLNDDVIKGYDFMQFLAYSIKTYGESMPLLIQKNTYQGVGSNYLFKPIVDRKGNIDNYENVMQFPLTFKDNKWILLDQIKEVKK